MSKIEKLIQEKFPFLFRYPRCASVRVEEFLMHKWAIRKLFPATYACDELLDLLCTGYSVENWKLLDQTDRLTKVCVFGERLITLQQITERDRSVDALISETKKEVLPCAHNGYNEIRVLIQNECERIENLNPPPKHIPFAFTT